MASSKGELTYRQKMFQANKEAKATVVSLVLCIVVWAVAGFGLAGLDVKVFGTPGTVGTWVFAIAVAVFLAKRVFADFDLDEEEEGANRD